MARHFFGIWTSLLLLSPVTLASVPDEPLNNSTISDGQGGRMSFKLYAKCLQMDTSACVGYKLFNAATSYLQNNTKHRNSWSEKENESGSRKSEMDNQVDNILFQRVLEYLKPDSWWNSPDDQNDELSSERRTIRIRRRMWLPIMMGIILKFGSMIPIVLSKLAFMGTVALISSKISLLIMGLMGMKKLFSGSDGGLSQYGQNFQDPHGYYGDYQNQYQQYQPYQQYQQQFPHHSAAGGQTQRVSYVVRGRALEDQNGWSPIVGEESKQTITNSSGIVFDNIVRRSDQSTGSSKQNLNTNFRKSRLLKRTDQQITNVEHRSVTNTSQTKESNFRKEVTTKSTNEVQLPENWNEENTHIPSSSTLSSEDNGAVPVGEGNFTPPSTEPGVTINATRLEYEQKHIGKDTDEDVNLEEDTTEVREENFPSVSSTESGSRELRKGPSRLVKRHHLGIMDEDRIQDHIRDYSAGQRRLDETEGEHVDAWVIRSKMSRA